MKQNLKSVHVIGGGLAGSEAAFQLAQWGIPVILHEMRPVRATFAHKTSDFAELVCSNSLRSDNHLNNAVGVLHQALREVNSLIMTSADTHKVPAGDALAVDREGFSDYITKTIHAHPLISCEIGEISSLPPEAWGQVIMATGPLTSENLSASLRHATGEDSLAFFDAIAPIIYKDSINMEKAWFQSRYDKGNGKDYINCPLSKEGYYQFVEALLTHEKTEFKEWEKNTPYFEGCLPIEVMAERGVETLRFGPLKPVGLTNLHSAERAYAVVQLRQDNALGTLYNMVGFQTKLKYGAQKEVFRMIPGLEEAEFARLGGIHRNTFICSPKVLDASLRLRAAPHIRMAGQVTGVEGYVESTAIGFLAALFIAEEYLGINHTPPPLTTAFGALLNHLTGGTHQDTFQPMNVNFGLFPPPEYEGKKPKKGDRKTLYAERALKDHQAWVKAHPLLAAKQNID